MSTLGRSISVGGIDAEHVIRGASRGFTVLVLGGIAQPVVSKILPVVGHLWLVIVAVVAFMIAGRQLGSAERPAVQGAAAAIVAYLLVVPVVLIATGGVDLTQLAFTSATAVLVGGTVGHFAGRRRRAQDGGRR